MCFGGKPKISAQKPPPAITPRQETDTNLPTKKDLVDDDTTAAVSYGSTKKRSGPAAGKKTGASGLKIALNAGNTSGANTGGLNV